LLALWLALSGKYGNASPARSEQPSLPTIAALINSRAKKSHVGGHGYEVLLC